jgi:hypothetical protein
VALLVFVRPQGVTWFSRLAPAATLLAAWARACLARLRFRQRVHAVAWNMLDAQVGVGESGGSEYWSMIGSGVGGRAGGWVG